MSDRPPPALPDLTKQEMDAILRNLNANFEMTRRQGETNAKDIASVKADVNDLKARVATVEDEIRGGVHRTPADSIPIEVQPLEGRLDHLSPPPLPTMRAPMSTHEELCALTLETQAQTPLLKKVAESQSKAESTQGKIVAAFVGTVLAVMVSQCQPSTVQAWVHAFHGGPTPAPIAAPAPATSH